MQHAIMPSVTVRNLSRTTVRALKLRAEANGHSMEQEIRNLLAAEAAEWKSVCEQIEASWADQQTRVSCEEIDSIIREGRR